MAFGPLDTARSKLMQKAFTTDDITIRDMPPTSVAVMQHRGDPATVGATIRQFIAWRKATGLTSKVSPTYNIFHSDSQATPPAEYRLDLCVGIDRPIEANGERIEAGTIPGARCAVLHVVGNTDNLEGAALYLYRDWLPASGEEARDSPLYCQLAYGRSAIFDARASVGSAQPMTSTQILLVATSMLNIWCLHVFDNPLLPFLTISFM